MKKADHMKKTLLFVVLSLLLPMALIQPASAGREVTITNDTPYSVNANIHYNTVFCKDDHPTIAAGKTWRIGIGLCLTMKYNFTADGHACEPWMSNGGNPVTFVVKPGKAFGYPKQFCFYTTAR